MCIPLHHNEHNSHKIKGNKLEHLISRFEI